MSDLLETVQEIIADIRKKNPNEESEVLAFKLIEEISSDPSLFHDIINDEQMNQINNAGSVASQINIGRGGIANVGINISGIDAETLRLALSDIFAKYSTETSSHNSNNIIARVFKQIYLYLSRPWRWASFQRSYLNYANQKVCEQIDRRGIVPPLDINNTYVPHILTNEYSNEIHSNLVENNYISLQKKITIWEYLQIAESKDIFRYFVILGVAGSGKTTLLKHLLSVYSKHKKEIKRLNINQLIPILFELGTCQNIVTNKKLITIE